MQNKFEVSHILRHLSHFLPSQGPLKDFIHHNTLHAFQDYSFHKALERASAIFGFKVYCGLDEYRKMYREGKISDAALESVISFRKGKQEVQSWKNKLLTASFDSSMNQRVGYTRSLAHKFWGQSFNKEVHPLLFRLISSYLDQGISIWRFPSKGNGFLGAIRTLERNSLFGFFGSKRVRNLLMDESLQMVDLLKLLVGDEAYYEQYIFDQQFAHTGWSGMVSTLEQKPEQLLDPRSVSLHDFIMVELLLEIDLLEKVKPGQWQSLSSCTGIEKINLFAEVKPRRIFEMLSVWQEAFEFSYFDPVLRSLVKDCKIEKQRSTVSFAGIFCIDDRECSLRRYFELNDTNCLTFGTPGFFNVDAFFQSEHGKFATKICPAPLKPSYLIKEKEARFSKRTASHFSKNSHGVIGGWILSQSLGVFSALKLAGSVFFPRKTVNMVSSFAHMDPKGILEIEVEGELNQEKGILQEGYTIEEMTNRVEAQLRSIGLIKDFPSLIYFFGHGSSSVNNTHYAGYDCGACSGRPGSVNARTAAYMANHQKVRELLKERGILIPDSCLFVGALHDTSRDEMQFFGIGKLPDHHRDLHLKNLKVFRKSLEQNAFERARRFYDLHVESNKRRIHEKMKRRSLSIFEPRPEWNHAGNCVCIIGRRETNKHVFLDRRSFLNSYDFSIDRDGKILHNILKAIAPVCGGINLEYFFSRTDNYRLGAGSKLPHNVVGLIGVANGMDGDLRPGLPRQMIDIHDPLRLMVVAEQSPAIIQHLLNSDPGLLQWFHHEWIHLFAIDPDSRQLYRFVDNQFLVYEPFTASIPSLKSIDELLFSKENLPVVILE